MADAFECRKIAGIDILQDEFRIRSAPEKFNGITPARVGSAGDRACRVICFGNDNVSGNADPR
jgi:hypothetical protein